MPLSKSVHPLLSAGSTHRGKSSLITCHLRFYTEIDYKFITLWHTVNTGLAPVVQPRNHSDMTEKLLTEI